MAPRYIGRLAKMEETMAIDDWTKIQDSWTVKELLGKGEWTQDIYVAITGFLQKDPGTAYAADGSDKKEGGDFVRIYTSLDLNEYVRVPTNAIVRVAPTPYPPTADTLKALAPITIWVSRFTKVQHAQRNNDETILRQERFLVGEIVDKYLPGASTEGLPLQQGGNLAQVLESLVQRCSIGGCGDSNPLVCRV
jgi:hypothetical protein